MTIEISSTDPRDLAALGLLLRSDTWQRRVTVRDGRRAYAIPSRSRPGLFWLTDGSDCGCEDRVKNGARCAHMRAAVLYRVRQAGQQGRRPAPKLTERQARAAATYRELFSEEA